MICLDCEATEGAQVRLCSLHGAADDMKSAIEQVAGWLESDPADNYKQDVYRTFLARVLRRALPGGQP